MSQSDINISSDTPERTQKNISEISEMNDNTSSPEKSKPHNTTAAASTGIKNKTAAYSPVVLLLIIIALAVLIIDMCLLFRFWIGVLFGLGIGLLSLIAGIILILNTPEKKESAEKKSGVSVPQTELHAIIPDRPPLIQRQMPDTASLPDRHYTWQKIIITAEALTVIMLVLMLLKVV